MNIDDFSWILVVEAVLPFAILSIILIFIITSGRKKFKLAARRLILAVKNNESEERQVLSQFLGQNLSLEKKQVKKQVKKIMNERKFLIRNLVSGLLDKNIEAIADLNQDLCRVSAAYHALKPVQQEAPEVVEEAPAAEQGGEDEKQIKQLSDEIKSLKQEVHITLTTLNNIFKEFSSMFGEDNVSQDPLSVEQIVTAMESFAGKSSSEVADDSSAAVQHKELNNDEAPTSASQTGNESSDVVENEEKLAEETLDTQLEQSLKDMGVDNTEMGEVVDKSLDNALDDIDSALDDLELDATEEEPDWGDAFAESGDVMDSDKKG